MSTEEAWPGGTADVAFLLPRYPRTVAAIDGAERLRDALDAVGVAQADGTPDVVVAPAGQARAAIERGADMLILDGSAPRWLSKAGFESTTLFALPNWHAPDLVIPVGAPHALRYALGSLRPAPDRLRVLRDRAVLLAAHPWTMRRLPGVVTLAARGGSVPFAVEAARAASVPPHVDWLLRVGHPSAAKRNVFFVFNRGARTPSWVVKVARRAGDERPFMREARGLSLAREAGPTVTSVAPRTLGRLVADGFHASVESAVPGVRLRDLLASTASRAAKTAALERAAAWTVEVARATAKPPPALADERRRLREAILPVWQPFGAPVDLVDRVPPVPAVFQHSDLWSANILAGPSSLSVIDWEAVNPKGLPLWDLLVLLADALSVADGRRTDDERVAHFVRLFRGELESSAIAFDWIRRARQASGIPPDAVAPIATLCWLERGYRPWSKGPPDAPPGQRGIKARLGHAWLSEPGLGPSWSHWA